ncbi:MAG: Nif3-like dinuclear metal center hexameric protein [Planctomycetota bacterium]|jgi:dinuclear metal center YbgI/SA1388 family protein
MAHRDRILSALDSYLKIGEFSDYAPQGLQVEGAALVKKVTTGVSLSMELLEKAVEAGSQMVMVHHGMFWKGASHVLKGSQKMRVAYLLEHDLTLAVYHLPLDVHPVVGNNAQIIKLLGGRVKERFGDYKGLIVGYIGIFDRAVGASKIMKQLELLSPDEMLFCPGKKKSVKRFGVVSGGVGGLYEQFIDADVDLFITGESWEPAQALSRETGVGYLAMGHYNSEKPGIIALGRWLKKKCKVNVEFVDIPNRA